MILLILGGWQRWAGLGLAILGILAILDTHPFRSSAFTQFDGDQGVAPYQEVLDYANQQGILAFWAHPESNRDVQDLGIIKMETKRYPNDILKTFGADGVETAYQDTIHITEAGMQWDMALMQYLRGERAKPLWGVGGIDFHLDQAGTRLYHVQSVLLVPELSAAAVLDALRRGRMYALRRGDDYQLVLHTFTLTELTTGKSAQAGETLVLQGPPSVPSIEAPQLQVIVAATNQQRVAVTVEIIRSGRRMELLQGTTPLRVLHRDEQADHKEPAFYRVYVQGPRPNYVVSNPIFVRPAAPAETAPPPAASSPGSSLGAAAPSNPAARAEAAGR